MYNYPTIGPHFILKWLMGFLEPLVQFIGIEKVDHIQWDKKLNAVYHKSSQIIIYGNSNIL